MGKITILDPKDNIHELIAAVIKVVQFVNTKYGDTLDLHSLTLEAIHAYKNLGDKDEANVGQDRSPLEVEPFMKGERPMLRITVYSRSIPNMCSAMTVDPTDRAKCVISAGALAVHVNETFRDSLDADAIACLMDKWFDTQEKKIVTGGGVI